MPKGFGCHRGGRLLVGAAIGAGAVAAVAATRPRRGHCHKSTVVVVSSGSGGVVEEWIVVHQSGVQWRSEPMYEARMSGPGPAYGTHLWGTVVSVRGKGKGKGKGKPCTDFLWVADTGYLPLNTPEGAPVLAKVVAHAQPPQNTPAQAVSQPYAPQNASAPPATSPPAYTATPAPPPPPPPAGNPVWNEHTDPATGNKYWHCPDTGVTTWNRPS